MKDIIKLLVALTLIACIAGLVLSVVEKATREPIAAQRKAQMVKALSAVLPDFDNSPDADSVVLENGVDKKGNPVLITFYRARKNNELVGTRVQDDRSGRLQRQHRDHDRRQTGSEHQRHRDPHPRRDPGVGEQDRRRLVQRDVPGQEP